MKVSLGIERTWPVVAARVVVLRMCALFYQSGVDAVVIGGVYCCPGIVLTGLTD